MGIYGDIFRKIMMYDDVLLQNWGDAIEIEYGNCRPSRIVRSCCRFEACSHQQNMVISQTIYTLWSSNMAVENPPFSLDFPSYKRPWLGHRDFPATFDDTVGISDDSTYPSLGKELDISILAFLHMLYLIYFSKVISQSKHHPQICSTRFPIFIEC